MFIASDLAQQKIRDSVAETYLGDYLKRGHTYLQTDHITMTEIPNFGKLDIVLDAGCGVGYASLKVAPKVRAIEGCDFSPESIRVFKETLQKQKVDNVKLTVADLTQPFPYSDEKFDKIISYQVLSYLPPAKLPFVFGEFRRVLKSGGRGHFTVLHHGWRGALRAQKSDISADINRHAYTPKEIRLFLSEAGLKRIKITGCMNSPDKLRKLSDRYRFIRLVVVSIDTLLTRFEISRFTGNLLYVSFQK